MTPSDQDWLARHYAASFAEGPGEDIFGPIFGPILDALRPPTPAELAVGQIWSVASKDPGKFKTFVLLTHVSEVLRGVVVEDAWLATCDDVIIPENAILHVERDLLAMLWSDTLIPRSALANYCGTVDDSVMNPILMRLQSKLTGGFILRSVDCFDWDGWRILYPTGDPKRDGLSAIRWTIRPVGTPESANATFITGIPVVSDDDSRLAVRRAIEQAMSWLGEEALAELK